MSRSLHTDPYPLRAARRVGAPRRRRADEPRVARLADDSARGRGEPGREHRVAIRVTPARPGFHHPAGVGDIEDLIARLGPETRYGVRRIELRHQPRAPRTGVAVAALHPPGLVVLYEQPHPPWSLPGVPTAAALHRLERAGARVRPEPFGTRVDWPGRTLRDFMLFDGLLHEIGHHRIQHRAGRVHTRAMRTADHERRADAYAAAARA